MKKMVAVLMVFLWVCTAVASTADDISKNVNKLIRNAEKAYFKGKADEAAAVLQEAQNGLAKLKSEAPDHRSLKSLQTKYDRLKANVDKKLGRSKSPTAPNGTAAPGPAKSSHASQDLSHGAKSNLKKAERELDFAEREVAKGEKSLQDNKFNLVESYIFNAGSQLESARVLLDKVITNNKANPDHPEVAAALDRQKALQAKLTSFTNLAQAKENGVKAKATQAKENDAKLNNKWLPKIMAFTDTSLDSRLQYPGSYNKQALDKQERLYDQASKVLADVEKDVPADQQPHELKRAVDKLRFALQVYDDEKKADNKNRLEPIENTLSGWEKRFEQNKKWNEKSDQALFVITKEKLAYQKKQIDELRKVSADNADRFGIRLSALEVENTTWTEKKRRWLERPRPFPQAKMKSKNLENDMERLLSDRGIEFKDLAITDKDWWVQPGEFRYVTTAVLSTDKKGKYWSNISFRQIKTLTGYGPTEIYDIDEIRVRLP